MPLWRASRLAPYVLGCSLNLSPRACQFCPLVLGVDLYASEKRLDKKPPDLRPAELVGLDRAEHQVAGAAVELHDAFPAVLGRLLLLGGFFKLTCDTLLFSFEHIHRDRIGVSHLHQLEALVLQPCDPASVSQEPGSLVGISYQQGVEPLADRFPVELVQLDPLGPGRRYPLLNLYSCQIRQVAALASVPSGAHEVIELAAVAPAGRVLQARSASATGEQSPQVVMMPPGLEHMLVPLVKDRLDPLEQFRLDESWMFARVLDAPVTDQ